MKLNLLSLCLAAGALGASASSASAVIFYATDFEAPAFAAGSLHGQDGWSGTYGLTSVLSSGQAWDGQAAAIGDAGGPGTGSATHSVSGTVLDPGLGPNGAGSYFQTEFAALAASGTDSFSFDFDFDLDYLSLNLTPNGTSLDVSWTSNAGTTTTGTTIPYAALTTLSVLFAPTGANDVLFTVEFDGLNMVGFNGVIPGLASGSWQGFGVGYTASNGGDALAFDNVTLHNVALVPEPGSLALAGLAMGSLLMRRRRS